MDLTSSIKSFINHLCFTYGERKNNYTKYIKTGFKDKVNISIKNRDLHRIKPGDV